MSDKVQQALELVKNFDEEETDKFLLGMKAIFQEQISEEQARGPVKAMITDPNNVWEKLTADLIDERDPNDRLYYYYGEALSKIRRTQGMDDVEFSSENIILETTDYHGNGKEFIGPRMFGNIPGVGCMTGGDWEWPVFFVIYLGTDGELYSYIPREGNCYNFETKAAFGNNDEEDEEFLSKWLSENKPELKINHLRPSEEHADLMFDGDKIIKEISEKLVEEI